MEFSRYSWKITFECPPFFSATINLCWSCPETQAILFPFSEIATPRITSQLLPPGANFWSIFPSGKKEMTVPSAYPAAVPFLLDENAVIGGEGNGVVIYPESHYGRDALVGVALFLTLLAKSGKKVSELKKTYPQYSIAKNKIQLTPDIDVDAILKAVKEHYASEKITDIDGVKIDFADCWVHLRKSNTEPIIRIYSEASTMEKAESLAEDMKKVIASLSK